MAGTAIEEKEKEIDHSTGTTKNATRDHTGAQRGAIMKGDAATTGADLMAALTGKDGIAQALARDSIVVAALNLLVTISSSLPCPQ